MGPDVCNPAFSRAIPQGTVIIDLLTEVVLFGSSWECRNDSFGDPKWSHLGTENGCSWGPKTDSLGDAE